MSYLTSRLLSSAVFITAFCSTASHAHAQHGTLNLPFEARLGAAVLPSGSYRFWVPLQVSWPEVIEISGNGKSAMIRAGIETSQPESDHSYLLLSNLGGTQVVRELRLGAAGKVFVFLLPKTTEKQMADIRKAQTTKLPIQVADHNFRKTLQE